jgi:hypothetical protein
MMSPEYIDRDVQASLCFFLYAFIILEALPRFSSGIHSLLANE